MVPNLQLIAATGVDWSRFVTNTESMIGRSPTRQLDKCCIEVGSLPTYLASLAEFNLQGSNPVAMGEFDPRLMEHMHFTFLLSCDPAVLMTLLKTSKDVKVISAEPAKNRENVIMTASLLAWRDMIILSCRREVDSDTRAVFNGIWTILAKLGFKDIFAGYRRKDVSDHTFILELSKR